MIVPLTHTFLWRCKDRDSLLKGCTKFNTFCTRLENQANAYFPIVENDTEVIKELQINEINKYKGDGFELFVEAMIRLFPCDKRLALIEDYEVITGQDVGVDGHGMSGYNNKPITVQCKYRQHDCVLTANRDHLTNFTSASLMHYNVDQVPDPITHKLNLVIITSGDSLNFFTDHEMFGEKVYAICRNDIRSLVDNNNTFWKSFAASWKDSLKKYKA